MQTEESGLKVAPERFQIPFSLAFLEAAGQRAGGGETSAVGLESAETQKRRATRRTEMRLGGPVYGSVSTPEEWRDAVARAGYRAAYCPVANTASDAEIEAYADGASHFIIGRP